MPPRKRKVVEEESSVDGSSGLSSPLSHEDLDLGAEDQKSTAAKKRRVGESGDLVAGKTAWPSRGKTIKKEVKDEEDEDEVKPAPKKPRKKFEVKKEASKVDGDKTAPAAAVAKQAKTKRKTKEEKEAEAMPLAARTIGHKLFIGAHVSSAGGQYFFRIQLCSIDSIPKKSYRNPFFN
jgi:AP endonuclease-1